MIELTKALLRPYAKITHTKKASCFDESSEYLSEHYGDLLTYNCKKFAKLQKSEEKFHPFGTLISKFERTENSTRYFELYKVNTLNKGFLKSRMHDSL